MNCNVYTMEGFSLSLLSLLLHCSCVQVGLRCRQMGNRWVNAPTSCESDGVCVWGGEVHRSKLECSSSEGILCLWEGIVVAGTKFLTNREGVVTSAQIKRLCRNSLYENRKWEGTGAGAGLDMFVDVVVSAGCSLWLPPFSQWNRKEVPQLRVRRGCRYGNFDNWVQVFSWEETISKEKNIPANISYEINFCTTQKSVFCVFVPTSSTTKYFIKIL